MANPDIPRMPESPFDPREIPELKENVEDGIVEETVKFLSGICNGGEKLKNDVMLSLDSLVKNGTMTENDKKDVTACLDELKTKGIVMKDGMVDMVKLRQFVRTLKYELLNSIKWFAIEMKNRNKR